MVMLQPEQWSALGRALFVAAGATESNTTRLMEALVDSSLVGHDSHGVIRIVQYLKAIAAGQIDPAAEPEVLKETAVTSLVDGKWTFGQVSGALCMHKAIDQARSQGIAMSALAPGHTTSGGLASTSATAHNEGMIGMVICSAGWWRGRGPGRRSRPVRRV